MKHPLILYMYMVIICFGYSKLEAQKLIIWKQDGTQLPYMISAIKTLTFSGNYLVMNTGSGSSENFSLGNLQKLTFDNASGTTNTMNMQTSNAIKLYYNASEDVICINNIPKNNSQILIYAISGVLMKQTFANTGNQVINVSNFTSGLYIVKINNQVLKFIK